jgi:hypothetical protein
MPRGNQNPELCTLCASVYNLQVCSAYAHICTVKKSSMKSPEASIRRLVSRGEALGDSSSCPFLVCETCSVPELFICSIWGATCPLRPLRNLSTCKVSCLTQFMRKIHYLPNCDRS